MTETYQLADIRPALNIAFSQRSSLLGSYLDNLGAYEYAVLTVLWQDLGRGNDSILSFAEKIRKAKN